MPGRTEQGDPLTSTANETRREAWEKRSEWPLTAASVVFLVAYAWPVLDPGIASSWRRVCLVLVWATWLLFVADYGARLALSRDRFLFVRSNLLDLLVVTLPFLRPLRLLRLVTLLTALNRHAGDSLRGKVGTYVGASTVLLLLIAALAILDAERDADDANITGFGDALWWALATVTTVGYGDRFPVTLTGRFVATGLMIAGIALLGVVTASVASWLVERVSEAGEGSESVSRSDIAALTAKVEALRHALIAQTVGHACQCSDATRSTGTGSAEASGDGPESE
jgi:voltage-gated potassium channel